MFGPFTVVILKSKEIVCNLVRGQCVPGNGHDDDRDRFAIIHVLHGLHFFRF